MADKQFKITKKNSKDLSRDIFFPSCSQTRVKLMTNALEFYLHIIVDPK